MKLYLGNKREIRTVFAISVPIIAENILQTLLGTTDTYFAGQVHDNAIAAIGVTSLIVNILLAFYTAVSVGTTAVVARNIGRKDQCRADLAATQSVLLAVGLGIIFGALSAVFCRPLLRLSGAEAQVLEYAVPYYLLVAVPSVFLCLSLVLSSCLRAAKDTKTPMIATIFANLLNIMLNYLFVRAGWGVIGLGLATTISRAATVAILFYKLRRGHNALQLGSNGWRPDRSMLGAITRIGIPAGAEKLIMRLGQLLYNGVIISLGTAAYVAHNVGGTIEGYAFIPAMGFGVATATLVGVSLGEGKPQKAQRLAFLANNLATLFMLAVAVVYFIFAPQLAAFFTPTKAVQDMVVTVLRFQAFFEPFTALSQVMASALQGAGDTKFPMYTTLVGIWGIRVCVGYLLAVVCGLGLLGFWIGSALDLTLRGLVLTARFLKGRWQAIQV